MHLNQIVTPEQYQKFFLRKRSIATIGNHYFCFSCKTDIPLKSYTKEQINNKQMICPHCSSNEVKLAFPKSLHSSNRADNVILVTCKKHGTFNINDFYNLRHEFLIDESKPPPDIFDKKLIKPKFKIVNALKIEEVNKEKENEIVNKEKENEIIEVSKLENINIFGSDLLEKIKKIINPKKCLSGNINLKSFGIEKGEFY